MVNLLPVLPWHAMIQGHDPFWGGEGQEQDATRLGQKITSAPGKRKGGKGKGKREKAKGKAYTSMECSPHAHRLRRHSILDHDLDDYLSSRRLQLP
jgi:hypothetical protein